MKKLGIIGGAGPLASALFYETLVHESYRLNRALPEILLLNYPFTRGLTFKEKEENGSIVRMELLNCRKALEDGGVEVAVLVCNTLHLELIDFPKSPLDFFYIPELVLKKIRGEKKERILLLGTQNTCNSSLYKDPAIIITYPSQEDQFILNEAINHILEGKILKNDSLLLEQIIKNYQEDIDGVILGCTDLPVLHHHYPLKASKPIYDSVKIPATTILRYL